MRHGKEQETEIKVGKREIKQKTAKRHFENKDSYVISLEQPQKEHNDIQFRYYNTEVETQESILQEFPEMEKRTGQVTYDTIFQENVEELEKAANLRIKTELSKAEVNPNQ